MPPSSPIALRRDGGVAHVTLSRPEMRNAFNAEMIADLRDTFTQLDTDPDIRIIILRGEGACFCGGADANWMRASLWLTQEQNLDDARRMAMMFRTVNSVSKPVVARVHGAALGGGAGLVAACDIAIAADDTIFGFTETKLGLLPAVISPFVMAKIGRSHMRALALTGEHFDAHHARHIGLVHQVVPHADLDAAVTRGIEELLNASPTAIAAAKALFSRIPHMNDDETLELTARTIAAQRTSAEGQDGLRAFLEKRPPSWAPQSLP